MSITVATYPVADPEKTRMVDAFDDTGFASVVNEAVAVMVRNLRARDIPDVFIAELVEAVVFDPNLEGRG